MRSRLSTLLLLIIIIALLTPGCTGTGKQDTNSTDITNGSATVSDTGSSAASHEQYVDEFKQGFGHNTAGSALFNNATALWNNNSYTDAAALLKQAESEYADATDHYHNMTLYAGNDTETAFAESMESSAINMDEASSRYLMSIDAEMAGNDTASLEYFSEGQELADDSMMGLNNSLQMMPPGLG